jgi:preprotein translocase subunit SecA
VGAARGDLPALLTDAPTDDYAIVEITLAWPALSPEHARIASALRLFVITRDPLDWIPGHGTAWSTAYANGDVLDELDVYVSLEEVRSRMEDADDPALAIAPFADAAVRTAAAIEPLLVSGGHAETAVRGGAPRLLEAIGETLELGVPSLTVRSDGWEPLGLGAIQDLVQEAFGPVDLDRSKVGLPPADEPEHFCPACRGERFGFPGALAEAQARMCPAHSEAATELTEARLSRARRSNPAGWRATGKASARINGLPEPASTPLPTRSGREPARNDPCPCGSGRKYKRCCGA